LARGRPVFSAMRDFSICKRIRLRVFGTRVMNVLIAVATAKRRAPQ